MKRSLVVVGSDERAQALGLALEAITSALIASGAPFVMPTDIAPHLGISAGAVRYYCRETKSLRLWQGQYRFELQDPEHILAMQDMIRLALWSMKSAPKHRKPIAH